MTNPDPTGTIRPSGLDVQDEMNQIRRELTALGQRALRAAGSFYTATPSGVRTFETGPDYTIPALTDGSPQWATTIRDTLGQKRFQLWDSNPPAHSPIAQITEQWDHQGHRTFATDVNGGIAEPWTATPMYPKFAMPAGAFQYMNLPVNVVETDMWATKIGRLYYPRIGLSGVWGAASGTNTTRYKLKIANTVVGTWDIAGLTVSSQGPFNTLVAAALGDVGVDLVLTAQTLSGTGNLACQLIDCQLRQTP